MEQSPDYDPKQTEENDDSVRIVELAEYGSESSPRRPSVDPTGCLGEHCKNLQCRNPFCTTTKIPNFANLESQIDLITQSLESCLDDVQVYNGFRGFKVPEHKLRLKQQFSRIYGIYTSLQKSQAYEEMLESYMSEDSKMPFNPGKEEVIESKHPIIKKRHSPDNICMACGNSVTGAFITQCGHFICEKCLDNIGLGKQDYWSCLACDSVVDSSVLRHQT